MGRHTTNTPRPTPIRDYYQQRSRALPPIDLFSLLTILALAAGVMWADSRFPDGWVMPFLDWRAPRLAVIGVGVAVPLMVVAVAHFLCRNPVGEDRRYSARGCVLASVFTMILGVGDWMLLACANRQGMVVEVALWPESPLLDDCVLALPWWLLFLMVNGLGVFLLIDNHRVESC